MLRLSTLSRSIIFHEADFFQAARMSPILKSGVKKRPENLIDSSFPSLRTQTENIGIVMLAGPLGAENIPA